MHSEWRDKPGDDKIELETDPRFPSGKWTGFWLQRMMVGRQYMGLWLTFASGRVIGEGCDRVGDFVMSGAYDLRDGRCSILKSYVGSHDVLYDGRNEDDGMWIWGLWRLQQLDQGGFHLWPEGEQDPTGRKLRAEERRPHARRRRRVKLVPDEIAV
jgi:hypothetical protein